MDKIAAGKQTLEYLFGTEAYNNILKILDKTKPGYSDYIFYSYGEFYSDKTLDSKTKELIVVAALITQKGAHAQLKGHMHGCKQLGITKKEITSAITQLTLYIGFPSVVNALMLVNDVYSDDTQ